MDKNWVRHMKKLAEKRKARKWAAKKARRAQRRRGN